MTRPSSRRLRAAWAASVTARSTSLFLGTALLALSGLLALAGEPAGDAAVRLTGRLVAAAAALQGPDQVPGDLLAGIARDGVKLAAAVWTFPLLLLLSVTLSVALLQVRLSPSRPGGLARGAVPDAPAGTARGALRRISTAAGMAAAVALPGVGVLVAAAHLPSLVGCPARAAGGEGFLDLLHLVARGAAGAGAVLLLVGLVEFLLARAAICEAASAGSPLEQRREAREEGPAPEVREVLRRRRPG